MAKRIYSAYHPQMGECDHKHSSVELALACIKIRKLPWWTCQKCDHTGHKKSEPDVCSACGNRVPGTFAVRKVGITLHTVHASEDEGVTYQPASMADLIAYGNKANKFSSRLKA